MLPGLWLSFNISCTQTEQHYIPNLNKHCLTAVWCANVQLSTFSECCEASVSHTAIMFHNEMNGPSPSATDADLWVASIAEEADGRRSHMAHVRTCAVHVRHKHEHKHGQHPAAILAHRSLSCLKWENSWFEQSVSMSEAFAETFVKTLGALRHSFEKDGIGCKCLQTNEVDIWEEGGAGVSWTSLNTVLYSSVVDCDEPDQRWPHLSWLCLVRFHVNFTGGHGGDHTMAVDSCGGQGWKNMLVHDKRRFLMPSVQEVQHVHWQHTWWNPL